MSARQLCIMACSFCRDRQFHDWMQDLFNEAAEADFHEDRAFAACEIGAKAFILSLCQVASRNELDTNHAAAQRFHQLVRGPFMLWKARQRAESAS